MIIPFVIIQTGVGFVMRELLLKRLAFFLAILLTGISIGGASYHLLSGEQVKAAISANDSQFLPIVFKSYPYDWLQFNGDPWHSGNNRMETAISVSTVGSLHLLFQTSLAGIADSSPVYLSNVSTPSGQHDLIFATTSAGKILALDAQTGTLLWSKQYGPAGCLINNNQTRNEACYTTSSPAIDPNREYVYSYGLDGYVHKYAVGDGTEIVTGGWPELTTLKGYDEKGSSALSIATAANGISYLYVAHAGYPGDAGNYQGHITSINLSDGTQRVFNSLCSNQTTHFVDSRITTGPDCYPNTMGAIWARPGVVYDPYHDRILMATGNGTFQPGNYLWGDSVFSLNPDGSSAGGRPLDSYTPSDYQYLQQYDLDLGSTAPAILPPDSGKYPHLAVQGGKDSILRLINLDNLSGQSGVGFTGGEIFTTTVPMGGQILPQPAVWTNPADRSTWIFVSDNSGMAAYQLAVNVAGDPSLILKWTSGGGTSPLVANGVIYIARSGLIRALKPTDGSLLWSDSQIGPIHWESPIVANGMLYITDSSGNLTSYALP
jgi:outer membrane protein assembly factor BamB